jgi:hypothetical protein
MQELNHVEQLLSPCYFPCVGSLVLNHTSPIGHPIGSQSYPTRIITTQFYLEIRKGSKKVLSSCNNSEVAELYQIRRVQCRVMHLRKSTCLGFQHNLPDLHLFPKKKPLKGIWDICK